MIIETKDIEKDSIKIGVGYDNHEGGDLIIKFNPGTLKGSIKVHDALGETVDHIHYELKYFSSKKDTLLTLYTLNKTEKIIDSTIYLRVFYEDSGSELGSATYYMVNKILISGNYTLIDTVNNKSQVSFTNEGKINGFDGFATYMINIDFMTPPNNLDEIIFNQYLENRKTYAINYKSDTLKLYETRYDKDSVQWTLDKLRYRLIRRK